MRTIVLEVSVSPFCRALVATGLTQADSDAAGGSMAFVPHPREWRQVGPSRRSNGASTTAGWCRVSAHDIVSGMARLDVCDKSHMNRSSKVIFYWLASHQGALQRLVARPLDWDLMWCKARLPCGLAHIPMSPCLEVSHGEISSD
jgi:hypothetical protein